MGRELQYLKWIQKTVILLQEGNILQAGSLTTLQLRPSDTKCLVSKCSSGARPAVLIPRKHPVKSAETLPKEGQPACLFRHKARIIPHLPYASVDRMEAWN